MRVALPVVLLLTLTFAGCFGGGGGGGGDDDEHEDYECPDGTTINPQDFPDHDNETFDIADHCPEDGGNGNGTNGNGNGTQNVAPELVLTIFDAPGGNVTNVTSVTDEVGSQLTFSADGSSDSDGQISGIAVTVDDGNRSQTKSLYANGQFTPATFDFDRPGIVNVTAAMVDDKAAFDIIETQVYVNHVVVKESREHNIGHPSHMATACAGPNTGGQTGAVDNLYSDDAAGFSVQANASFIEVSRVLTGTSPSSVYAICTPEKTAISPSFNTAGPNVSNNAEPLPASANYFIFTVHRSGAQTLATYTITVHYEPMAPAPAA
jgi:hypothetical protein